MSRPLDGIRVLEVGQYIAAPYCAMLLADQGAEVIKIERPGTGDPRRAYDPFYEKDGRKASGGFLGYNRNKKSVTIDLSQPEGAAAFRRLARAADVVIENLAPGTMDRLGLGYTSLAADNPRLIYCAISGFGRLPEFQGPYAGQRSFDATIQAMSGVMSMTGEPGGSPSLGLSGFADIYTGVFGALAVGSALYGRERTGKGTFIDQAMYDTMASLAERALLLHELTGWIPKPGQDLYSPLGPIRVKDGTITIVVPTDEMFVRFCKAIERLDLLDHPQLSTVLDRAKHFQDVLRPEAEKWTTRHSRSEVMDRFVAAGLPVGIVQTIDEVYACPQLEARKMMLTIDEPALGAFHVIRTPLLFSAYERADNRTPPQLGEDTQAVLSEVAGIGADELQALRAKGAV